MNKTPKTTPPPDPEEEEALREIAEEREEKYGGRDRWVLTVMFLITAFFAFWEFRQKQLLALFFAACTLLSATWAFVNWRSWRKKSPAQRLAVPPAISFKALEIRDCSAPFSQAQFLELRKAFGRNLVLAVLAFLYAFMGLIGVAAPLQPVRLIALSIAAAAIHIGRRPAQRVWRARKSALACPKCHDLLTSQTRHVLQTGHCRTCGNLILTDHGAEIADVKSAVPEAKTAKPRRATRSSRVQYDPARVFDVIILLSGPTFCLFYFGWNSKSFGAAGVLVIGIMLAFLGALFSFAPVALFEEKYDRDSEPLGGKSESHSKTNASSWTRLPWVDFAVMTAVPIAIVVGLCYLIWIHHVLTQLQLGLAAIALPGAIFLVSYAVVRHVGHRVKKTGKAASERFAWTLVGFWCMAVFVFVVCAVSWIQKFALKW